MKFSVTVSEAGSREKLVLESGTDLPRHIALKLLAYVLYRNRTGGLRLEIERSVGQRHKPDLVATDPDTGRIRLWIDCGQIETERLARIVAKNPATEVVVIKSTAREAVRYAQAAAREVPGGATVLGFDDDFVDTVVEALRGTNHLEWERTGEEIALTLNGVPLVSQITRVVISDSTQRA